jgi:transposase InsO family protein
MLEWLGVGKSKYHQWQKRYGQANRHNGQIPRHFWLVEWEKAAILAYEIDHSGEGYRRLAFMMLDEDVVAVSPSSVYRVLKEAGRLNKWAKKPSKKGTGFQQPLKEHQHWHIDIAYLNICGRFYYLCSLLDGYSRYVVHWEIREQMREMDVEFIIQRGREKFPQARPRIISDNGPQFVAKDFKEFIRLCGMSHVRTSLYYPQSNGKLERWHKTVKGECIRPGTPLCLEDAQRLVAQFVAYYNNKRLHSAIGYITPQDKLAGREAQIFAERRRKLEQARENRRRSRQQMGEEMVAVEGEIYPLPEETTTTKSTQSIALE